MAQLPSQPPLSNIVFVDSLLGSGSLHQYFRADRQFRSHSPAIFQSFPTRRTWAHWVDRDEYDVADSVSEST
jgi:hypothetical protein